MTTPDKVDTFETVAALWRKLRLADSHYVTVSRYGVVDIQLDLDADEKENLTTVLDVAWKYGKTAVWRPDLADTEERPDRTGFGTYSVRFEQDGVPFFLYARLSSEPVPFAAVSPEGKLEQIRTEKREDVRLEDDVWSEFSAAHAEGYI